MDEQANYLTIITFDELVRNFVNELEATIFNRKSKWQFISFDWRSNQTTGYLTLFNSEANLSFEIQIDLIGPQSLVASATDILHKAERSAKHASDEFSCLHEQNQIQDAATDERNA